MVAEARTRRGHATGGGPAAVRTIQGLGRAAFELRPIRRCAAEVAVEGVLFKVGEDAVQGVVLLPGQVAEHGLLAGGDARGRVGEGSKARRGGGEGGGDAALAGRRAQEESAPFEAVDQRGHALRGGQHRSGQVSDGDRRLLREHGEDGELAWGQTGRGQVALELPLQRCRQPHDPIPEELIGVDARGLVGWSTRGTEPCHG